MERTPNGGRPVISVRGEEGTGNEVGMCPARGAAVRSPMRGVNRVQVRGKAKGACRGH